MASCRKMIDKIDLKHAGDCKPPLRGMVQKYDLENPMKAIS